MSFVVDSVVELRWKVLELGYPHRLPVSVKMNRLSETWARQTPAKI